VSSPRKCHVRQRFRAHWRYSCKNYRLANLFPARAVALGCLFVVMQERGLRITEGRTKWVDDISSRKVDYEDFEEVVEALRSI